jgi:hypothetical protein
LRKALRLAKTTTSGSYKDLVARTKVAPPAPKTAERELDHLVACWGDRDKSGPSGPAGGPPDPVVALRDLLMRELIPIFVELVEKYSNSGLSLQMDASNLLEGGREIKFEFGLGEHRTQLQGTVTNDAIAFHEVRYAPDIDGQLVAGPMLRLKQLNAQVFREFICERLALLLRAAARRK